MYLCMFQLSSHYTTVMNDKNQNSSVNELLQSVKRLASLHFDYARLTAAEKMTVLLSTIAFYSMVVIVGTLVLIFVSIGVGHMLASTIARVPAYLYVAAFYLVLFILLFVLRKKLFIDPIARFISKLFVKPPEE